MAGMPQFVCTTLLHVIIANFDANFSLKGITNFFGLIPTIIAYLFGGLPWIMVQMLLLWLIPDQHQEITAVITYIYVASNHV